jgi:mono/diheme cytochrome c family protein
MRSAALLPAAALWTAVAGAAAAADAPDPERGRALAERWCAECHVVASGGIGGDAGPPLATLRPATGATDAALRAWLFDPHEPMPDIELAPGEIADIIAHIRALQAGGAGE